MLTDRQNKFRERIIELSELSSSVNTEERKYFLQAKKRFDSGRDFKTTVNALSLVLETLDLKDEGLSLDAKSLSEDLEKAYGKPTGSNPYLSVMANVVKAGGPWRDELETTPYGIGRKKEPTNQTRNNVSAILPMAVILIFIIVLIVLCLLFH